MPRHAEQTNSSDKPADLAISPYVKPFPDLAWRIASFISVLFIGTAPCVDLADGPPATVYLVKWVAGNT